MLTTIFLSDKVTLASRQPKGGRSCRKIRPKIFAYYAAPQNPGAADIAAAAWNAPNPALRNITSVKIATFPAARQSNKTTEPIWPGFYINNIY
jgi:hypothetical protein